MNKVIILILFVGSCFVDAQEGKVVTAGFKSQKVQAEAKKKADVYGTIADELLKNCEGADKVIAVARFSYSDGRDSMDGGVVAERITTELVKVKRIKVIERKEIERVFQELKLQRSGAIDSDSVKEIGKLLGADWVVVGTLTELPDKQVELNARIVGVESGEIINATNAQLKKDWLDKYRKLLAEKIKNPKDAKTFYDRGVINNDLEEYNNAIANFGIAITINPTYGGAYYSRGLAYLRKGDNDKAIEDYTKAIQLQPDDWMAFNDRGVAYARKGDLDKSIEDFTVPISLNPTHPLAYWNRGFSYMHKGEFDKAVPDFSKVVELKPEFKGPNGASESAQYWRRSAYFNSGAAYYDKGEYDKAIPIFDETIKTDPDFAAVAYYFRGMSYLRGKEKRVPQGMADLSMAIELNPEYGDAYRDRGIFSYMNVMTKSGAGSDLTKANAISDLSKAIEINPKDADLYNTRAMFYQFSKEYKKALSDFDMAIELDPSLKSRAAAQWWRDMTAKMLSLQESE